MEIIEKMNLANVNIATINIHEKDYAPVNQRTIAFRSVHPLGCIEASIIENTQDVITIEARIYTEENKLLAKAHASEKKSDKGINEKNAIENCETSAIGRALGFCGYGINTAICSSEDMQRVEEVKATDKQCNYIRKLYEPSVYPQIMKEFNVSSFEDLTLSQATELIKRRLNEKE